MVLPTFLAGSFTRSTPMVEYVDGLGQALTDWGNEWWYEWQSDPDRDNDEDPMDPEQLWTVVSEGNGEVVLSRKQWNYIENRDEVTPVTFSTGDWVAHGSTSGHLVVAQKEGRWKSDEYGRPYDLNDLLATDAPYGPPPQFGSIGGYLAGASGTSAAIAVPAGVQPGDVIVADLFKENTASVTCPAGFTEVGPVASTTGSQDQSHYQYWKRATAADTGTYTFSWSGSTWRTGVATRYTGCVASGNPFDPVGAGATATRNSTGATTPGVQQTTTGPNRLLVWSASSWDTGSWGTPAGFTARLTTPSSRLLTVATKEQAAAGGSNNVSASGPNYAHTARLVALRSS